MKRLLSIDGGGIRGLIPALLLTEVEARTSKAIADLVDLIAGTSTGGILAIGLVQRIAAKDLAALYANRGPEIFSTTWRRKACKLFGLGGPKYSADALEAILKQLVGDAWLSQTVGPELLVPAAACNSTSSAWWFKSWEARGIKLDVGDDQDDCDFPLWAIARATSAAPMYFPVAQICNRNNRPLVAVDGGLVSNNPEECAIAAARDLWPDEPLRMLSLGTGSAFTTVPVKPSWGLFKWAPHLIDFMMQSAEEIETYKSSLQLGPDHIRIDSNFNGMLDDVRPANIAAMQAVAAQLAGGADFARAIASL
jgi:patatin-like phospholipase/acyl hydrolase